MSAPKRPLAEIPQGRTTPARRAIATPRAIQRTVSRPNSHARTITATRYADASSTRPGSARGILRRLARVTAGTTLRRIKTPQSAAQDKENRTLLQNDQDEAYGLQKPTLNFDLEDTIEEDDSELPVAPTPSALLRDTSDDEDSEPTSTFHGALQVAIAAPNHRPGPLRNSLATQSDPAAPIDSDDEPGGETTFLSERGRRAISDEPTRMSRYSFGSIRMSEFGSELEIRRTTDRHRKSAALEAEDDYGEYFVDNDIQFGGETEVLRRATTILPQTPAQASNSGASDMLEIAVASDQTLRLDSPDMYDVDIDAQQKLSGSDPPPLTDEKVNQNKEATLIVDVMTDTDNGNVPNRRESLLEAMVATAASARPRKTLRLNKCGNLVPALPSNLMKRIVHASQDKANKRKTTLGKDHLRALEQATEWFFEQVSEDLEAYSSHGRRKKRIDSRDVLLLMRRQRLVQNEGDLLKLAKNWLPREIRNELELADRP